MAAAAAAAAVTAGCSSAREARQVQQCPGSTARVAGGTRCVREAAEHKVVPVVSRFSEKVKQSKAGIGREAGPQEEERDGGRRAKMTLWASSGSSKKRKAKMGTVVSQLSAFIF